VRELERGRSLLDGRIEQSEAQAKQFSALREKFDEKIAQTALLQQQVFQLQNNQTNLLSELDKQGRNELSAEEQRRKLQE